MTLEEAARLRPGDAVELISKGAWVPGVVVGLPELRHNADYEAFVEVECRTLRRANTRTVAAYYPHGDPYRFVEVRLAPRLEPGRANVYADWLDEHGEPVAAAKLREAFPLAAEGRAG